MQRSKVFLFFFALVASTAASPALFDDLDVSLDDDNDFLEEGESHSLGKNEELQVAGLILTGVNLGRQLCNKAEFSTFEVVNTTVKAGTKDLQVTILASNDKEKHKFTATLRQEKNGQWSIVSQIHPNPCSERKAAAGRAAAAVARVPAVDAGTVAPAATIAAAAPKATTIAATAAAAPTTTAASKITTAPLKVAAATAAAAPKATFPARTGARAAARAAAPVAAPVAARAAAPVATVAARTAAPVATFPARAATVAARAAAPVATIAAAVPAAVATNKKKDEDEEDVEEEGDHLLEDPLDFLDDDAPVAAKKKKARVNVNSKSIIPGEVVGIDVNRADVQAAKNHVFEQIQLGRKGCKKPVYKSVRVLQALVQPGAGAEYALELQVTPLNAKEKPRNFAASIRRLPKYKNRFHASTGAPKEWNTLQLSPEPCSSATLAYSLSDFAAHNSDPSRTHDVRMYPGMLHATEPLWGISKAEIDFDSIPADKIEHIDVEALQMTDSFPDSYDYRKVAPGCAAIKEILSQGVCGSCYAQAAATVYGAALHKNSNGRYNIKLSAREGADCTKGCAGGFSSDVWKYMQSSQGIVEEYCDPETKMPGQCGPKCGSAPAWKVQDFKYLLLRGMTVDVAEKALMQAVLAYGPVSISFVAFTGFENYGGGVYTVAAGAQPVGGHSVTLLGWGVDPVGGKYWLMQNSYGAGWGMGGYFMIRRGENVASVESYIAMYVVPATTPTGAGASCTTRCKNMGTLKADCSCTCPGMWSGADCGTCQPGNCQNGGTFDRSSCSCNCPPGLTGNDCSQARVLLNTNKVCTDGSGAPMTLSWTAPSSVGSFCKVINSLRLETGVTQLFCGAASDWSMQNANCPQTGSAQFDMTALRGLPYGSYVLRCAQYMGTNEFKQSKGYEWIDDKADLAKFEVTNTGCSSTSSAEEEEDIAIDNTDNSKMIDDDFSDDLFDDVEMEERRSPLAMDLEEEVAKELIGNEDDEN